MCYNFSGSAIPGALGGAWGLRCNCWEFTADKEIWSGPGSQRRRSNCILRNQCYENRTDHRVRAALCSDFSESSLTKRLQYISGIIDWQQAAPHTCWPPGSCGGRNLHGGPGTGGDWKASDKIPFEESDNPRG